MHSDNGTSIFQTPGFRNNPGIIIGTGPSLDVEMVKRAQACGAKLFGINNTYLDFDLDVWIACDPSWHRIYSPVKGDFLKFHWDKSICDKHGYHYIEGRWGTGPNRCDGLSLDQRYIAYGHSSGFQALNLALHFGCSPILLVGYDMHYDSSARHYFSGLSGTDGEYPQEIRKFSKFNGLVTCYEQVAKQKLNIINCTPGSALRCFDDSDLYSQFPEIRNMRKGDC